MGLSDFEEAEVGRHAGHAEHAEVLRQWRPVRVDFAHAFAIRQPVALHAGDADHVVARGEVRVAGFDKTRPMYSARSVVTSAAVAGATPASTLARDFLKSSCICRPIWMRWAWGEPGAVHGLGEVAHGVAAQGHVLDQAQDAHAVLRGDVGPALQVLADQVPTSGVQLRSCSDGSVTIRPPARSWARRRFRREARDVVLADVGDHVVAEETPDAISCLVAGGDAGGVDRLVQVGHLHQLVPHVGGLLDAVVVGDGGGAPISTSPTPDLQT
jgi:hypothetical protein